MTVREPFAQIIDEHRLLELYDSALTVGGRGRKAPPLVGCLAGCLGNAWTAELYRRDVEAKAAGLLFAAYLFVYLLRGHCFVDGNKRVAWLALVDVLAYYRVEPLCDVNDVTVLCEGLLRPGSLLTADDFIDWLVPRLQACDLR